jgi:hypothetical protein
VTDFSQIELFVLKCAVIENELRVSLADYREPSFSRAEGLFDEKIDQFIKQFELSNRTNAAKMAQYYQIFYMLENDMRRLIVETLETAHGADWWNARVSDAVKQEVTKNKNREVQAGVSLRSDDEIDYTTFGQLGDIIRENWADFAGMLSNQSAVARVFSALNMLRGTIAHCGVLAEDEVDRLILGIRDWFRVLEGPQA